MTRVVVVDSGVKATHPHVSEHGAVRLGPVVLADGTLGEEAAHVDRLGHGTAVAAAILDLARDVELVSIKVFDDRPACPFDNLLRGLELALAEEPRFINLSIGVTRPEQIEALAAVVARCREAGVTLVAPASADGLPSYPGSLDGVEGVIPDANRDRRAPDRRDIGGRDLWFASPYPRDLPGIPREANLSGVSMATANVTGYLASRTET